ncbi:Hypothetical protein, putative, partial [Bodo saltans]
DSRTLLGGGAALSDLRNEKESHENQQQQREGYAVGRRATHALPTSSQMDALFEMPWLPPASEPPPSYRPIVSSGVFEAQSFEIDGAVFDGFDIDDDDSFPMLERKPSAAGERRTSNSKRWSHAAPPIRRSVAQRDVSSNVAVTYDLDASNNDAGVALTMEMTIDPDLITFDDFFMHDGFGDDVELEASAVVLVVHRSLTMMSLQSDDDVLSAVLKANLQPATSMTRSKSAHRMEEGASVSLAVAFPDDFDFSQVPSFDLDELEHEKEDRFQVSDIAMVRSIVSMRRAPPREDRVGVPLTTIDRHTESPDELDNLSDDLDELLARNLPALHSSAQQRGAPVDLFPMGYPPEVHHHDDRAQLQDLLGSIDLNALYFFDEDDDDIIFSPSSLPQNRGDNPSANPLNADTVGLQATSVQNSTASSDPRRRSSTLNALPLSAVGSQRRKSHMGTDVLNGTRDVIERRLTKALCALQATYLLTPRLFGSVIADVERQGGTEDGAVDQTSSPSALSMRLERHLRGVMELEAHAMRLLVHWERLKAQQ